MGVDRALLVSFGILLVVAAARLAVLEDEAYYWTWSRHLAAHYYDHPPLIAWLIRGAQAALGAAWLALRAVSLACILVTVLAVTGAAASLAPRAPAVRADAAWALAGSLLFSVALLPATPDAPLAAALSLMTYALVRGSRPEGRRWLPMAGILLGVAGLAKLPAGLVGLGLIAGALITPEGRRMARTKEAGLAGAMAVAPVLAWWYSAPGLPPSVVFQFGRVTGASARWLTAVPLTLGAVLLMVGPAVSLALVATRPEIGSSRTRPAVPMLLGAAATVLAGCLVAVALGSGELNWLLPVLICGVPPAVATASGRPWRRRFRIAVRLQAILTTLVLIHIVQPVWPIPPEKDRTLRSVGWAGVAEQTARTAQAHEASVLVTATYQRASLLRYHLQDRWPVREVGGYRQSQYDLWPRPSLAAGQVAVVVQSTPEVGPGFESLGPARPVDRQRGGRVVERLYVVPVRWTGPASGGTLDD